MGDRAMDATLEVRDILGLRNIGPKKASSLLHLVDLAERGFPVSTLDQISKRIAPSDVTFKYRIVPKATLARAKSGSSRLSSAQSTLIARLAKIWVLARTAWGSDEATRDFLLRQHQLLEGRRPIDVAIENELGGELVREILGRLQNGSAV
jgi:putative toxin-antitoxin system antitoxin component (TIGR02293 family)